MRQMAYRLRQVDTGGVQGENSGVRQVIYRMRKVEYTVRQVEADGDT